VNVAAIAMTAAELGRKRLVFSPVYELRYLGDPILKTVCTPVESRDGLLELVASLRTIRDRDRGLGLSANQVGDTRRVFVARTSRTDDEVFVNPELFGDRGELVNCPEEGCLSIPGFRTSTKRHTWINVRWEREGLGAEHSRRFDGTAAQVIQHELDHLDGKLITDGVSRQQRRAAERLVEKALASR
jgi:peptide deformylase